MAANSILKLKVDNTEYDANIKKAAEGIQHLAKRMHDAQGDFEGLDKASLDFIKNVQYMTTSAKTASGQYRELENAYKNLAATYEGLNAFEKEGDAGKALAEQLEVLKSRTLDMKANMDAASKSLQTNAVEGQENSDVLSKLADKFTVNVDALKLFDWGLQAVSGALDVAKDAFFSNEENLDEWGRTVESSESLYKGFLNALNTGDISGYLSNMSNIVKAAREAYDAMDELNTFNAFNQVNVEKTRTSMTESIVNYREGNGTKEAVKAAGEAYKKELKDRQRLEKEAYLDAIGKVAAERGVSKKDLVDALSGTYGHYQDLKKVQPTGTASQYIQAGVGGQGYYQTYKVAKNDQERLGEALRKLNDTEIQSLQALGAQAERTSNEVAQVDKQIVRVLNGRQDSGSSGGGKSGNGKGKVSAVYAEDSIAWQEQEVARLTKMWKEAGDAVRDDYALQLSYAKQKLAEMTGGFNPNNVRPIADLSGKAPSPDFSRDLKMDGQKQYDAMAPVAPDKIEFSDGLQQKMDSLTKGGQDTAKAWRSAQSAIGSVGNALSGLKNPAIDIMTVIGQAIATVALAYAETLAKDKSSKSNIWTFIAAAAASTISLATTIASIHSSTGYAQGGIVKGNSYSGDNIYAGNDTMVNAGELILNRSQQLAVASQLQSNSPLGGGRLVARLKGADILLSLERQLAVTGKGELATFK